MSEDRLVSVIVCTYNRGNHLPKIIDLLLSQDYSKEKFEIIIVDNGSTDNTENMVERFLEKSEVSVIYTKEPRRGVTFARNRGSEIARHPYLAYVDDDCTVGRRWLRSLMSGYNLDQNVFAVFGKVINDWGEQTKPSWMGLETETWLGDNTFLGNSPKILENGSGTREGNLTIKKEALKSFSGFLGMEQFGSRDMAAAELKYCLWQAMRNGAKIAYMPAAVARHRIIPRSKSWMVKRAYWQGISDGIFKYIITKRNCWDLWTRACLDLAAMIALFSAASFHTILFNQSKGIFHLLRAVRRYGLILSELHLKGNWRRVVMWLRKQPS